MILDQFLRDQLVFGDSQASTLNWPLYVAHMPDSSRTVDELGAVSETQGVKDGRLMTGFLVFKYGLQVLIRSLTYEEGYAKAVEVQEVLQAVGGQETATVGAGSSAITYTLLNFSQQGPILPLGQEEGTKRRWLFSINYLATIADSDDVPPIEGGGTGGLVETLAHTVDATLPALQLEGWWHTNSGAGALAVRLTLPAAADQLNAGFAQVDVGIFYIQPGPSDFFKTSTGNLAVGQAYKLTVPLSKIKIFSDGNTRWMIEDESGSALAE
jgi:hypothetical protein